MAHHPRYPRGRERHREVRQSPHSAAEEFSRAIDQLLAGSAETGKDAADELKLASEMVALARARTPEGGFAAALERRLLRAAGQRMRAPRPLVARRWAYAGAGLALVAVAVTLAVVLLVGRPPP